MYRYVQIASPFESGSPWKNVSIVSLQIKNKQWCSLPVKHGDPRTPCFLWNWYDVFIVLSRKRLITHHHHVSSSFWLITPWYIHVVKPTVCVTFDFRRKTISHTCEYSNPHVIPMLSLCMVNLRRESHAFSVTLPVLEASQWAPSHPQPDLLAPRSTWTWRVRSSTWYFENFWDMWCNRNVRKKKTQTTKGNRYACQIFQRLHFLESKWRLRKITSSRYPLKKAVKTKQQRWWSSFVHSPA